MAILNLIPTLSVCPTTKCTKFEFTDTTGVYNVTTNPGGWENAATELGTNITAATITLTDPTGTVLPIINVLTSIPTIVVGSFPILPITIATPLDGEWQATYSLTSSGGTKTINFCFYVTCLVRCCIDKLWSIVAVDTNNTCKCTGDQSASELAIFAESLLSALESSTACDNATTRNALLLKLQRLCKLQNCKCK